VASLPLPTVTSARRALAGLMIVLSTSPALAACSLLGDGQATSTQGQASGAGLAPTSGTAVGEASTAASAGTSTAGTSAAPAGSSTTTAAAAGGSLPGCMIGSWAAPISRESQQLNLAQKSKGAITSVSGTARMVYAARTFTFTYDKVSFKIKNAGDAKVTGSLSGTYTVAAGTMRSKITKSKVKVTIIVGGTVIPADQAFNGFATGLAPSDVKVTCKPNELDFTSKTGSTVTFDKV